MTDDGLGGKPEIREPLTTGKRGYGALFSALSKAQGQMKGAKKDSENPHFRSRYADLASIWDACREALAANGLSVIQLPYLREGYVGVTTVLGHSSGEWIESRAEAKPVNETAQGIGAVITYLRRFGLAAMVGVAPEDDDGETAVGRGGWQSRPAPPPRPPLQAPPKTTKAPPPAEMAGSGASEEPIPFEDGSEPEGGIPADYVPPAEVQAALQNRNLGPWLRWFLDTLGGQAPGDNQIAFADLWLNEIRAVKKSGGRNWVALDRALQEFGYHP